MADRMYAEIEIGGNVPENLVPGIKMELLSRNEFRSSVFSRDGYKCVFCDSEAKDAHHILERRLFPDGGYYLNNGASVCEEHHIDCENTSITVEALRIACGITSPVIPPSLIF